MVLRDELQSTLGDAYTIERELTGGGMSRVYVALDRNLGRPVVVKLLDPEIASGVSISRFEREIRMAATLQHPCIVPVLTAGEANSMTRAMTLGNRNAHTLAGMVGILAARGELEAARPYRDELLARREKQYVAPSVVASGFWSLGEEDTALEWMNLAVDERDWLCYLLATEIYYDAEQRRDPRIQHVVKRIGIPIRGR